MKTFDFTRRKFFRAGALGAAAWWAGAKAVPQAQACMDCLVDKLKGKYPIGETRLVGTQVVPAASAPGLPAVNGYRQLPPDAPIDPMSYLTAFDYGQVTQLPDGRTQREYHVWAEDKELEVAAGIKFAAWVYNGFLPGPTLRAVEGDRLLIHFENRGSKPHTIHFHGVHASNMDGVFELVPKGKTFTYDFVAEPYGIFPYHCHMMPLRKHISRGLFGTLIVDPRPARPAAKELVMVMHGLDVDFDMENEFYAVNGVANYYAEHPIDLEVGEKVRIYLSNMTEFDLVNNFHLHANMFDWYPSGTALTAVEHTDTVNLCQGQRGILEFTYRYPGMYMFHAHTSEFAELGWMGFFNVKEKVVA